MNTPSWRSRVTETLVLILAIALVARVVSGLLEPFLPTLIALVVISTLVIAVMRRH